MTDPNSLLTRFRRYVARRLYPEPDPGEAWCVGCCMNNGKTLILSADGARDHAAGHDGARVSMQIMWPHDEPEEVP